MASATLASSSGSVENLKVSAFHGFTPYRFQAAATVTWLVPSRSASSRDDQCVTPGLRAAASTSRPRSGADRSTASGRTAAHRLAQAARARHSGSAMRSPSAGSPPPAGRSPRSAGPRRPTVRSGPARPTPHPPNSTGSTPTSSSRSLSRSSKGSASHQPRLSLPCIRKLNYLTRHRPGLDH
jgi:hypothetical protein